MMEKLTFEVMDCGQCVDADLIQKEEITDNHYCWSGKAIDKIAEYEDAEEQGLILKMDCKIGDTVWLIVNAIIKSENKQIVQIISAEVLEIKTNKYQPIWYISKSEYAHYDFTTENIGKTIFLTRPEAEQALKVMEVDI